MVQPLLKWAGGKRWLVPSLKHLLKDIAIAEVVEPFCGSAAVSLGLEVERASLNDTNNELVAALEGIRDSPEQIARALRRWPIDEVTFSRVATLRPRTANTRAARMIYLNRTAFNGLWRENRAGRFNVPFGCKATTTLPTAQELRRHAEVMRRFQITSGDFREVDFSPGLGKLVFVDPPYIRQPGQREVFARYGANPFQPDDESDLRELLAASADAGTYIVHTALAPNKGAIDPVDRQRFVRWDQLARALRFVGSRGTHGRVEVVWLSQALADAMADAARVREITA